MSFPWGGTFGGSAAGHVCFFLGGLFLSLPNPASSAGGPTAAVHRNGVGADGFAECHLDYLGVIVAEKCSKML